MRAERSIICTHSTGNRFDVAKVVLCSPGFRCGLPEQDALALEATGEYLRTVRVLELVQTWNPTYAVACRYIVQCRHALRQGQAPFADKWQSTAVVRYPVDRPECS